MDVTFKELESVPKNELLAKGGTSSQINYGSERSPELHSA